MRRDLLHVITPVFNPIGWKSRIQLYKQFQEHMLDSGVKLTLVECVVGDRAYEIEDHAHVTHIKLRTNSLVWNKENTINIGINRSPHDAEYFAWIDADVMFRNNNWAYDTVNALQIYPMLQPWHNCYDLGPNGEHLQAHTSFCKLYHEGKPIQVREQDKYSEFGHPGYAWAARRDVLEKLGMLIETAALGAADHHMACALAGDVERTYPKAVTEAYKRPLLQWQARAEQHVARHIGSVPGTIEHFFHGPKVARGYQSRWEILIDHAFDPDMDLKKNSHGVVELAGNKPHLRNAIDRYLRKRNEDSNSA